MELHPGDIATMKKNHPCGGNTFEITRAGMDVKLKCLTCGHEIIMPRKKAEKAIRSIAAPSERDTHV